MTAAATRDTRDEARLGATFIARLRRRLAQDPGFAARLRRAADTPLDESRLLVEWYGFLDDGPTPFTVQLGDPSSVSIAFLVATLFAHDRRAYRRTSAHGADEHAADSVPAPGQQRERGSLGGTLAQLRKAAKVEKDPMSRRLAVLLDSDLDRNGRGTLPWRLRRIITLALQQQTHVDWARLLDDLLKWVNPRYRDSVRRTWAQDYYRLQRTSDGADTAPAEGTI